MTYRQILAPLQIGESHTFQTRDEAKNAAKAAYKLYGRVYHLNWLTITRVE